GNFGEQVELVVVNLADDRILLDAAIPGTGAEGDLSEIVADLDGGVLEVLAQLGAAEDVIGVVAHADFTFESRTRRVTHHDGGGHGKSANGFAVVAHHRSLL